MPAGTGSGTGRLVLGCHGSCTPCNEPKQLRVTDRLSEQVNTLAQNSRITEVVLSQSLRSMSFHCPSTCPKFASLEFFQIFFNTRLPELVLFHCHQFHAAAIAVTAALASLPETSPVFMNCLNMSCESPEISIAALGNHGCAVFCVNRRMLLAQGLANDLTIRWLCRSHPG